MAKSELSRAKRLRGIREDSNRWLDVLRGQRSQLRHIPQPLPTDGLGLWELLFRRESIVELENLWAAHVDLTARSRSVSSMRSQDATAQWTAQTFRHHYGVDGPPPRQEYEIARVEAVLFLRWLEWGEVDKEYISRRYATSRARVKDLSDFATLAARAIGLNKPYPVTAIMNRDKWPSEPTPATSALRSDSADANITNAGPILDPFSALRVKIASRYLAYLDKACSNPCTNILISDTTGLARGFENWSGNDSIYQGALYVNKQYITLYRKRNGSAGIGFRRTFFLDPVRMTHASVERMCNTLRFHLRHGLQSAVCCSLNGSENPWFADLAMVGDLVAVDFGFFESIYDDYNGPKEMFCLPDQSHFAQIKELLMWTIDPINRDVRIMNDDADISILANELHHELKIRQSVK